MKLKILNLTQHTPTSEQVEVVEPIPEIKIHIKTLLTFSSTPSPQEIRERAEKLADIAQRLGYKSAMIGGALWLMGPLEKALRKRGISPLYAFTTREVVEEKLPDGSIKKTTVFKHHGFVEGVVE